MRWVYVPENLTPFYLLELQELSTLLWDRLQGEMRQLMATGRPEQALTSAEHFLTAVQAKQDRHAAALVLLYKAEALRRLQRWEEALDCTQQAVEWLHMQVTPVAHYNYAVALYFAGLLHFVLGADVKTLHTFTLAQEILGESERYWGFENNSERVAACRDMSRWMANLLELPPHMPPDEVVQIVPVYELVNQTPLRTGAMVVTPFQVTLPYEELGKYLPTGYIPLAIETLPFLQLHPYARYLAYKITSDGYLLKQTRAGDVLLIEVLSSASPAHEMELTHEAPFVRQIDGRILFGPYDRTHKGFVGIPRVLIREKEDEG